MSGAEKGAWAVRHAGNCSFLDSRDLQKQTLGRMQPVLPPSFPIVLRRVAWRRRMTPDFDEEVVFEVRGKWRCVWIAFVWLGRGRRRGGRARGRSRGEESGDAPAGLGHRISAISGPNVGRSLTGVAWGSLAAPGLCLGPSRNSQPGRWTRTLLVPTHPYDLASPFLVLDLFGSVSRNASGHSSRSRRGPRNGGSRC